MMRSKDKFSGIPRIELAVLEDTEPSMEAGFSEVVDPFDERDEAGRR
jgi:hypothetical protein